MPDRPLGRRNELASSIDSTAVSRRDFVKRGAGVAASLAASSPLLARAPAISRPGAQEDSVRLAWIGVGGRGSSLLGRAVKDASKSNSRVTAICDIDPKALRRGIDACGSMKPVGIEDYREVLDRKDVDVVFIATPIQLHEEMAVAAAQAGKNTYCEKPLGRTPEEVKSVYEAVKKAGIRFQVGFQWRYHSGFLGFVEKVQGGACGKVSFVTGERHVPGYPESGWYVDRNLSGDLIVEQAVHEMNVFCWMLQSHPLRAAGFGGINALEGRPTNRTIMDSYAVTFEFPQNIRLNYSHCVYAGNGFSHLHQTVYGGRHQACTLEGTTELFVTEDGRRTKIDLPPLRDATGLAIESFVDCVRNDKEPLSNVDAGRHATLMAILGRMAIHEKRVVEWSEVAL